MELNEWQKKMLDKNCNIKVEGKERFGMSAMAIKISQEVKRLNETSEESKR